MKKNDTEDQHVTTSTAADAPVSEPVGPSAYADGYCAGYEAALSDVQAGMKKKGRYDALGAAREHYNGSLSRWAANNSGAAAPKLER